MKRPSLLVMAVTGALLWSGCESPKVVQGAVVSYDAGAKILVVRDELEPHGEVRLSTATAEIGAEPRPGDLVRVAFADQSGSLVAGRVMNLTRQDELRGGKSGH